MKPIFGVLILSWLLLATQNVFAEGSPLAFGGSAGVEFPFSHHSTFENGIAAEAFWRKDPYELRFHFSDNETKTYSVLIAIKYFFSNSALRPYIEGAVGPSIVDPEKKGLAYGFRPEASLGADLGLSKNLSFGIATRYFGLIYFGDTSSGKWEANHGLDLMVNVAVWF